MPTFEEVFRGISSDGPCKKVPQWKELKKLRKMCLLGKTKYWKIVCEHIVFLYPAQDPEELKREEFLRQIFSDCSNMWLRPEMSRTFTTSIK